MQTTEHPANEELRWVESFAHMLDSRFTIPGTKFRFGLDPIIGLIPGVGDIASFAISGILVMIMARHGASQKVVVLMTLNILLDTILGGIPVIGNIFDFFYKANDRNLRLLKKHYGEGKYQGSGKGIIVALALFLLLILGLMLWGMIELVKWVIHLF